MNKKRYIPDFGKDNYVYIIKQTKTTDYLNTKLDFPFLRTLYRILDILPNDNYRFKVPEGWTASQVFYTSRL